ncbi:MAG: hypothetical protein H6Q71_2732 [Firmicutes bacterium]|nr:hypothetical protein [Bacillota bacterium]
MKKLLIAVIVGIMGLSIAGCSADDSSRAKEQQQQEQTQQESIAQAGTPAIKNFREKKLLKDIYEMRDQEGLTTYTYIVAENTGKLIFLGETIGYGIPAATQYNNPEQALGYSEHKYTIPQAEPNGLYSPQSAEGTWIMLKGPNAKAVKPVYVEPRIVVSPFKLDIAS